MSDPLNTTNDTYTRNAESYTSRPSRPSASNAKSSSTHAEEDFEANIDKFATLFSPSTPRASPTYTSVGLPGGSDSTSRRTSIRRPHPRPRIPEEDSEFGAFVFVPAAEDPLSSDIPTFDIDHLQPPMQVTGPSMLEPSNFTGPASSRPSSSSLAAQEPDNKTLNFFDQFAQDAKKSSEQRGRHLVEELLMHEDDPMYFLKEEEGKLKMPGTPPNTAFPATFDTSMSNLDPLNSSSTPPAAPGNAIIDPLAHLDLDSNYFSPRSQTASRPIPYPGNGHRRSSSHPRRESSMPVGSPVASPILTAPALAPPLASTPLVNSMRQSPSIGEEEERKDLSNKSGASRERNKPSPPPRSNSYQTLSSLSSKWMSSLLPSSRPGDKPGEKRPSLETIFASGSGSGGGGTPPSRSHTPVLPQTQEHHGYTTPQPVYSSHSMPSHLNSLPPSNIPSSPFGISTVTHSSSPFASHIFIPPSGAPGFKGEGYDWDKGFSSELERELLDGVQGGIRKYASEGGGIRREGSGVGSGREMGANIGSKREEQGIGMEAQGQRNHQRDASAGMGSLIEKKIGGVELKGMRENTTPILTGALADLIRPSLPALFRLPRNWNLLYSLDQHGISLNTLYARCEAHFSKPGNIGNSGSALVVVKDAGDAVFGVWIGEGIRMSKGKGYFGSGESFLWSYKEDKLKVHKWTGKNDYVALCEPEYISFGGGDGRYGLYLDNTLYDGSSAPCTTFGNEPLCSPGPLKAGAVEFECVGLEVWAVGP